MRGADGKVTQVKGLVLLSLRSDELPILHAVAPSIDRNDLGVVEEAVEQGRGEHVIAEQGAPTR